MCNASKIILNSLALQIAVYAYETVWHGLDEEDNGDVRLLLKHELNLASKCNA